jgi:hypothetical protein
MVSSVLHRLPDSLYRFTALDGDRLKWNERLIVNSELFFATSDRFNDPIESGVLPDFSAPRLTIESHWKRVGREQFPTASKKEIKKRVGDLRRQSSTTEGRERLTQKLAALLRRNGMACFATDPTSVLLWSYYASGHSGIAIRFGTDRDRLIAFLQMMAGQGAQTLPVEVTYADDFPRVNFYKGSLDDKLQAFLGTKAAAWKHENEWRMVLTGQSGLYKIPDDMITGIVFGLRTSRDHEQTVRSWVARRRTPLHLFRIKHKPGSFLLEVVPAS